MRKEGGPRNGPPRRRRRRAGLDIRCRSTSRAIPSSRGALRRPQRAAQPFERRLTLIRTLRGCGHPGRYRTQQNSCQMARVLLWGAHGMLNHRLRQPGRGARAVRQALHASAAHRRPNGRAQARADLGPELDHQRCRVAVQGMEPQHANAVDPGHDFSTASSKSTSEPTSTSRRRSCWRRGQTARSTWRSCSGLWRIEPQ